MALNLADFRAEQVLGVDEIGKTVTVAGGFEWDSERKVAIIKLVLPVPAADTVIAGKNPQLVFENSLFRKYTAEMRLEAVVEVIYPATKAIYYKHLKANFYLIAETSAIYASITRPYIDSVPASNTEWVRNVLEGKKEVDKVWYREEEFILAVDYKLQSVQKDSFYFLAITETRLGLRSLRDLTAQHLPLLTRIQTASLHTISSKLGISPHSILTYVHYPPSFYHFHVHFVPLEGLQGNTVPRAHLMSEIIGNLERDGAYYQQATLPMLIRDSEPIYESVRTVLPSLPEANSPALPSILDRLE
jgi:m7GpppX diphosphatase